MQANKWIKNMYNDLEIYNPQTKNFLKKMSDSVYNGKCVLLEDIDEDIDPGLQPIIGKEIKKVGGCWEISIGGAGVTYNLDFKFILTTKMGNPTY